MCDELGACTEHQRTRKMIRALQKLDYRIEQLHVVRNAPTIAQ